MDSFTIYTWIYLLDTKLEAMQAFKLFLMFFKTQFNTTIKVVQSDNGGEFRPFTNFLNELGISHRLTYPYNSHQNGTVERKHRHIIEMGLKLLAHSSISLKYWDHIFVTLVHIINRLSSSGLT